MICAPPKLKKMKHFLKNLQFVLDHKGHVCNIATGIWMISGVTTTKYCLYFMTTTQELHDLKINFTTV